jgi:hypothetical protein
MAVMRYLQLPACVQLRPKSLAILREVGVEITHNETGNTISYDDGVAQVLCCVLEIEKSYAADLAMHLAEAISSVEDAIRGATGRPVSREHELFRT